MTTETKQDIARKYIVAGITKDISATAIESISTFFFSTIDKKGYTIKTTLCWHDESIITYTKVEPYMEMNERIVDEMTNEAKNAFAITIYDKIFSKQ